MNVFICLVLLIAGVSCLPFKRQQDPFGKLEQVYQILEEYGIDVEAVEERMTEYWEAPEVHEDIKAIISKFLPDGVSVDDVMAKLEEIDGESISDEEKLEKIKGLIQQSGADPEQILKEVFAYLSDPAHLEVFKEVIMELLPEGVDPKELFEHIKALYGQK